MCRQHYLNACLRYGTEDLSSLPDRSGVHVRLGLFYEYRARLPGDQLTGKSEEPEYAITRRGCRNGKSGENQIHNGGVTVSENLNVVDTRDEFSNYRYQSISLTPLHNLRIQLMKRKAAVASIFKKRNLLDSRNGILRQDTAELVLRAELNLKRPASHL